MSLTVSRTAAFIALAATTPAACATPPPLHVVAPAASAPSAASVAFADADRTVTTTIVSGVTHTFVRDGRGPWVIHIVVVDPRTCGPVLEARKPGAALNERATTSSLAAGALVGINADFFMLPGGTPVGAHVSDGVPLIGPTDRPLFAVTAAGWRIGTARVRGYARVSGDSAAIEQVNRPAAAFAAYRGTGSGLTLFTAWIGDSVPPDSAARRATIRLLQGDEAAGRGIIMSSDSPATALRMQPGTAVLLAHGEDRAWLRRRAVGDTISWSVRVLVDAPAATPSPAMEAVGGFPVLLREGRNALEGQTVAASFGSRRHPRTAVGWTPDGRLLL
ncbi:MAG: phosphodiester glycosidase family protein, partial [Longimicrobiales bacterium]